MRFGKKRRASVSPFFIGLPITIMVVTIALAGAGFNPILGGSSNNGVCNANVLPLTAQTTSTSASTSSTTTTTSTSVAGAQCSGVNNSNLVQINNCPYVSTRQVIGPITVTLPGAPCSITTPLDPSATCPSNPPPPSYCGPTIPVFHPIPTWFLPAGATVTILLNQTGNTPPNTSNGVFFNLGTVGPSGFISIIGVILGIVCLAGITVLGTGAGTESIHILFMGGMMMGIWLFLSGLDGFGSSNPNSIFVELDALSAGSGTGFYIILTFLYFIGFAGMVKRGV